MNELWQTEELLDQFRTWLDQTRAEVEQVRDERRCSAHPDLERDDYCGDLHGELLNSDDKNSSLDELQLTAEQNDPLPDVGMLPLFGAFSALRQELKLQTKSARGLEEIVQSAVRGLDSAVQQFHATRSREQETLVVATKPFVESLLDCHEALLRAQRAFETLQKSQLLSLPQVVGTCLDRQFVKLSRWRQKFVYDWYRQMRQAAMDAVGQEVHADVERLIQGFGMIIVRMNRALRDHKVRRIDCLGLRVNPAEMAVVELVDAGAPPETVVEEIRPGYYWNDSVLRFAEVKAQRPTN